MVARVLLSRSTFTRSLASMAWWSPSLYRRPNMSRPGELVHDDHLAVLDDVVDVLLHHAVGLDGLVDVVGQVEFSGSERLSTWKKASALLTPRAVRVAVRAFSSTM